MCPIHDVYLRNVAPRLELGASKALSFEVSLVLADASYKVRRNQFDVHANQLLFK